MIWRLGAKIIWRLFPAHGWSWMLAIDWDFNWISTGSLCIRPGLPHRMVSGLKSKCSSREWGRGKLCHLIWLTVGRHTMPLLLNYIHWSSTKAHPVSRRGGMDFYSYCVHACSPWWKWCEESSFIHVWLFATLCTVARQALVFMGFSRQECWSGRTFPPSGDHPDPGIEPLSPAIAGDSLLLSHWGSPYWNVVRL